MCRNTCSLTGVTVLEGYEPSEVDPWGRKWVGAGQCPEVDSLVPVPVCSLLSDNGNNVSSFLTLLQSLLLQHDGWYSSHCSQISPLVSCFKYLETEKRKLTNKATKLTFPIGTSQETPSSGHSGWLSVMFDYEGLASLLQTDVQKLLQTKTQMPEIHFRLKDYKNPSPLIAEQDDA